MKETAVAERYSRALFQAIPKPEELESVLDQLRQANRLLDGDRKIAMTLQNPLVRQDQKKELLKKSLGNVSPFLLRFLNLVIAKKRIQLLPLILLKLEQIVDDTRGHLKAYVKSASALDEKSKKEIEIKLSRLFNKKVVIENSVSPELLAGVVIKAGDTVIDNSLKMQLKNLETKLKSEGNVWQ